MPEQMILFDLANRHNVSWSPNPWKTRLALNYKKIPYTTEWVEYPDLAPKFKALGIPPNSDDDPQKFADYSSPTVRFEDGTYVMDSMRIVEKLEATHPQPSLHLDTGLHVQAASVGHEMLFAFVPGLYPVVCKEWLQEPSKSWFEEDRRGRLGMSVYELAEKAGGENGRAAKEQALGKLRNLLTSSKKDDGPFLIGSKVSYGDLIIAAVFESLERLGESDYEMAMGYDKSFRELHEACRPWAKKDD